MKGRLLALATVMFILSSSIFMSFTSVADIAPVRVISGGNLAVFVQSQVVIMDSYVVDVEVDLPYVNESLSYCLYNPTNATLNLTVMIPFNQQYNSQYSEVNLVIPEYLPQNATGDVDNFILAAELNIDGIAKAVRPGDIAHTTFCGISFEGVYTSVTLLGNSYTNISLICHKFAWEWTGHPVEEFSYFYSAETAAFWNGTVRHGTFDLSYHGNWESTNFTAPDAVNNGPEVHSEVWDIDVRNVDANYSVHIITGDVTPPYERPGKYLWILPLGVALAVLAAMICIGVIRRQKRGK